jgi:hypothetical protein
MSDDATKDANNRTGGQDPDAARGINPVQHSEGRQGSEQAAEGDAGAGDERTGEGTGARAGEYS